MKKLATVLSLIVCLILFGCTDSKVSNTGAPSVTVSSDNVVTKSIIFPSEIESAGLKLDVKNGTLEDGYARYTDQSDLMIIEIRAKNLSTLNEREKDYELDNIVNNYIVQDDGIGGGYFQHPQDPLYIIWFATDDNGGVIKISVQGTTTNLSDSTVFNAMLEIRKKIAI